MVKFGISEQIQTKIPTCLYKPKWYLAERISAEIGATSLEWSTWGRGEFLNISEFSRLRSKDGQKDKTIIVDKEGSLMTSDEYEQITLDAGPGDIAELPYFPKVSKIGEISYCAEGICNRMAYRAWRNMFYAS